MRSFFINGYEIKKICCLFFAGEVIMYALIAPFMGIDSISFSYMADGCNFNITNNNTVCNLYN